MRRKLVPVVQGLEELGLELGGIVVLVAIVLLALRHSARLCANERREVEQLESVMIAVAARTGLRHLPGAVYEHPVGGAIRGYGCLLGSLHGVQVYVAVERPGSVSVSTRSRSTTAGPVSTRPSHAKREPWQGQSQLRSAGFQVTWQPRCVQTGETRCSRPCSSR
jgi:hypothetical protein